MAKNSFGHLFKITTFGESHGPALGVIIDGCPAGVFFERSLLDDFMRRRRPGENFLVSQRQEKDQVEVLSGIFQNKTLGTPIAMMVRNKDAKSEDYEQIKKTPRKGHADDLWKKKFSHVDYRGGGRSSGRETVSRVMAGAVAKMYIQKIHPSFEILSFVNQVGPYETDGDLLGSEKTQKEVAALLVKAREQGKSYGGQITLKISGLPLGLGQPVFHKFKADLASALLGIGASCGLDIAGGSSLRYEEGARLHGRDQEKSPYGGIRGGITTGEDVIVKLSFKPTSSVLNIAKQGRHDPCIALRALVVAEAMSLLVIADHLLWSSGDRLKI